MNSRFLDPQLAAGNNDTQHALEKAREDIARLTRENRAYARQVELLRTAARTTVDELDTLVLAQALARLAAQAASAERATVCILEYDAVVAQSQYHAPEVTEGPIHQYDHKLSPGAGCGLGPEVVSTGRAVLCHDARVDPRLGEEFATRFKVRNAACVPIMNHQSNVLAFIEVFNRTGGGFFTGDDLHRLETLALQASVGLQRGRLVERLAEWSRSLEMLLAFSAAVNQHLDPTHLMRNLVENAALFVKAEGGMAGLVVAAENGERQMACDGLWIHKRWLDWRRRWRAQEGLAGLVMESAFPHLSNNYPEEPFADPELAHHFAVRAALCVPVKGPDDIVIGFFELHRLTPQSPFTWQDAAFLESLANVTAVAIRNAQLLKAVEAKNQEIQALSANHVNLLEEERRHISRELHDEAGQILIGIKLALQVAARDVAPNQVELRQDLDDLRDQVNRATERLKDLARRLRPPTLDQLGLEIALRQLATDLQAGGDLRVELDLESPDTPLRQEWDITLYRIAQEALTNIVRHARAQVATVELHYYPDKIRLCVRDSGRGFEEAAVTAGLGLLGMRERATMLGGSLAVRSLVGHGTVIEVEVPRR
ncbi:MAG: GAF domain-containing sensor histidine kinase [Bryobacteraceae bacterium]|nr:GAF domain-containing sensor histidine kinase [Bryobacteraceae bacterium]